MSYVVERVQTGVRLEKRLLKVLKGLSEYLDLSLGDLLEGMVLHAFEGKAPFSPTTRAKIEQLKVVYGLDLDAEASHRLVEAGGATAAKRARPPPQWTGQIRPFVDGSKPAISGRGPRQVSFTP